MIENLHLASNELAAAFDYETLFPFVNKPSRYLGGELNSIKKPASFQKGAVGVCLCFPDLYETGFANTGIEILYRIVNLREDAFAERAYAADTDYAELLRARKIPFCSLESRIPLSKFDIVGFGLPYELCFTNILEMLDLSGIPLRAESRQSTFPLLIGGGPCVVNPEPLADFFDAFVIGDGEDAIGEIVECVRLHKSSDKDKPELLRALAQIPGVYVPALYSVRYHPDGSVAEIKPKFAGVPEKVAYRQHNLGNKMSDGFSFPVAPVVPFVQTVHDRLNIDVQRGCPWRCRFCQAGFSYHTYRERSMDDVVKIVEAGLKNTGYDAVTLAGLSVADHREIVPMLQTLAEKFSSRRVSIGLPSTRADRFTLALAEILNRVRRQSVTFAPEAGTERLRRVIRKELQETEIRETLRIAHKNGWKNVKLYFMYGLPTETPEDLDGIVRLVRDSRKENPGLSLTLTLSPFVPKPHTPFQWERQTTADTLRQKLSFLRKNLPALIRAHGLEQIVVEGVLSRGDRRCSALLEECWKLGSKFDEWSERFRFDLWQKSFEITGLTPEFFAYRQRAETEIFPWDHLEGGPDKRALWNDYQTSIRQAEEPLPVPHIKERPAVSVSAAETHTDADSVPRTIPLASAAKTVQKLRFRISRKGSVRFLSHLEQIEMVRRALRRTGLPLHYSSGFHPQIRCSFGPAISVGYESECEYFEVDFCGRADSAETFRILAKEMPHGFALLKVSRVPVFFPSLESLLNRVRYEVQVPDNLLAGRSAQELNESLRDFLAREDIALEKVKNSKNGAGRVRRILLKPLIVQMEWLGANSVELVLRFGPGKNAKPEKIIALYLGLSTDDSRSLLVNRRAFYIEKQDGALAEP